MGAFKYATNTTYHGLFYTVDPEVHSDIDYYTDVFGRTTKVVERATAGAGTIDTSYTYTPLGDLATITDDAGNVTSYGYDWLRHRTSANDPDQGASTTWYDEDGNMSETLDAANTRLQYTYDVLDRKTKVAVAGAATPLAEWTYDGATSGIGKPWQAIRNVTGAGVGLDGTYTTAVTGYDGRGRPTGKSLALPSTVPNLGGPYTTSYTYDASSNVTSVTMPAIGAFTSPETLTTTYNPAGLPQTLTGADGLIVKDTTYRGDGRIASRVLPHATGEITRAYTYDATLGRLATITTTIFGVAAPAEQLSYDYDGDSNVTSVTDLPAGGGTTAQRECFVYDPLNRLTRAATKAANGAPTTDCPDAAHPTRQVDPAFGADGYDASYTYDDLGNMTSATTTKGGGTPAAQTYTYTPTASGGPHAVSAITPAVPGGGTDYQYDANGQTTDRPDPHASKLVWDELHQLRSTTGSATDAETYVYDADGPRLIRKADKTTTLYLDGAELSVTVDANGATTATKATRYYGSVAMRTQTTGQTAIFTILLRNQQNSATTSIPGDSNAATYQRFLPYGALRGSSLSATDRGFLDKTRDPSGLVVMGARYYDPAINRFVSVDPITNASAPQSLAGYSYSLGNPTSMVDPGGLEPHHNADGTWGGFGCSDGSCNSDNQIEDTKNHNRASEVAPSKRRQQIRSILDDLDRMKARDRNNYYEYVARACPQMLYGSDCETYYRLDVVTSKLFPPGFWESVLDLVSILLLLTPLAVEGATEVGVVENSAVLTEDAPFAQLTYREAFSADGIFAGKTIDDIAEALRSGAMSAKDIPINTVTRDGTRLILNTRSAQALTRAGIPRTEWLVIERTEDALYEELLSGQLERNSLDSTGTRTVVSKG
jgi:RHS repeat-associated protein